MPARAPGRNLGRRTALVACAAGLVLIAVARVATPSAPPLYDGVVVTEPYRYASPGPGEAGSPTSFTASQPVTGGANPALAAATNENPPQAQLIASAGAFAVTSSTKSLTVTIDPLAPDASATTVRGNIYRFRVTDQAGADVPAAPGASITIVLRAPANVLDPQMIVAGSNGGWTPLSRQQGAASGFITANVTTLGEYAITGSIAGGGTGVETPLLALAAIVGLGSVALLAFVVWWMRRPRRPTGARPTPSRRPRNRSTRSGRR